MVCGIERLNVYAGQVRIEATALIAGRGLDPDRLDNIQQIERSVGLGCEDPVTNAVNAARPIIAALGAEAETIELLIVTTESGVDFSKSIASYVHRHLGLSSRCRYVEAKQACYAATGMLQLAAGYLAAGFSPGARALVIATDVALVDERAGFSEISTGFGAVAMLIGGQPDLFKLDLGAFGLHSYETPDSARPTPTMDIADIDRSLFAYLDCLSGSFGHYVERVAGADFVESFGLLAMHTPFPGIVKAGHRKLMRENVRPVTPDAIDADFARRVAPSLAWPRLVGNLCSGSLYLALASQIANRSDLAAVRAGLFSYGSGCASEFFSGVIGSGAASILADASIEEHLTRRTLIDFVTYLELLNHTKNILVPKENSKCDYSVFEKFLPLDRSEMLVLSGTSGYYRNYEWI